MGDIAIVGAPGTGKTTLAKQLVEQDEEITYVRMARHSVLVPYTLYQTRQPNLFSYDRDEYVRVVVGNIDVDVSPAKDAMRDELDRFGKRIFATFGETVTSEITFAIRGEKKNVFDNVAKAANVEYMQERGVHIVGLTAGTETKVKRRLEQDKAMEPSSESELREQMRATEEFTETERCLECADVVYDTEDLPRDYTPILSELRAVLAE